jgi:hypothetical protein
MVDDILPPSFVAKLPAGTGQYATGQYAAVHLVYSIDAHRCKWWQMHAACAQELTDNQTLSR